MIINTVDNWDRTIGTIDRADVFRARVNFRVVHVFVFNDAGLLLLQQISSGRRHPSQWGSSVAGYVLAGETYDRSVRRKVSEELGVKPIRLSRIGKTPMIDLGCTKFITLYSARHLGPFSPDHSQVSALEFVSLPRIREMHALKQRVFTPTFLHLLDFFEHQRKRINNAPPC